jgi:serine/threonine protein kinase
VVTETIAHYRVFRKLGAGGMGEVYEAEDLRLGRHAALKFLPDAVSHDAHALERFEREARAASSLDHPNICTIYEIGEHEGRVFLAMQLLEGKDLRQKIGGHPLPLDDILELGMQIADALDAAHAQGIIHRDIKPSNIFVTARGQAKLLDFGLAKFNNPNIAGGDASSGTTISQGFLSSPASVMGTLSYMSPEQALGMALDSRSDLFSLGAVLYEMATGTPPFSGTTSAAIFDAILNKHPIPALRLNPSIPEELDHIINKALEKDREVRSQTAAEVRAELKRLKRDTSSGKILLDPPKPVAPIKKRPWSWIAAAGALILAILVAAWFLFPLPPPRVTGSEQITHDGLMKFGLATDGSRIYFGESSGGHLILSQVSVTGGEVSQIPTPFRNVKIGDISPDHSQLLIGTVEGTSPYVTTWSLPLPSGPPRRLGDVTASSSGTWSPDMRQLVFTKGPEIWLANADGSGAHMLLSVKGRPHSIRFSPDQFHLRFTIENPDKFSSSLWEVRVDGTELHPLLPGWHNPPTECCGFWTLDGRYYLFLSRTETTGDIYALPSRTGSLRRTSSTPVPLTVGPLRFDWIMPSADSKKLFTIAIQPRAQVVRYDPITKVFVPYLSGISATDLAFSGDGKWVAYVSISDGSLWRSRTDGSERLQLTYPPERAVLPVWSPDGSQIAFEGFLEGQGWKALSVPFQGGATQNLLPSGSGVDFNWTNDGKQLIFSVGPNDKPLYIRTLDLSTQQISKFPGSDNLFSPRLSPDGKYLAALSQDSATLVLYDFRGQKWSQWVTEHGNITFPTWSKDSQYIYFDNFLTDHPTSRRVRLGATQSEELFSLENLNRHTGSASGTWGGLAPEGSRLYVEDLSVQEIYALDLRLP